MWEPLGGRNRITQSSFSRGAPMNYTFFIGNGFDLGMGLRTSYSDFLDSYKRLRTKNTELDESRHWLFEEVLAGGRL